MKSKLIAIDEMRHAEMFAERIKDLGGEPTTDLAARVGKAQKLEAVFPFDAGLEGETMDAYSRFLPVCRENGDSTSMKLFETVVDEGAGPFQLFRQRERTHSQARAGLPCPDRRDAGGHRPAVQGVRLRPGRVMFIFRRRGFPQAPSF